jgi:hypothetical protein
VKTSLKTKSEATRERRDVLADAKQSADTTRRVSERLSVAAGVPLLSLWSASLLSGAVSLAGYVLSPGRGLHRAFNRAVLVGHCADAENVWTAEKMEDAEGREFDAYGVKCPCGSRLCSHCIKLLQRRAQHRLVAARDMYWSLNTPQPQNNEYERFVTLTGPTLQGVSEQEAEKIYNHAFLLLSDTPFWVDRMKAGAKHLEFTVNSLGYHAHIHSLVYGPFIERDADREAKSVAWRKERAEKAKARGWTIKEKLPALGNLQDTWTRCLSKAVLAKAGRIIEWRANYDDSFKAFILGPYSLINTREKIVPEVKVGWYSLLPDEQGEVLEVTPTPSRKAGVDVRQVREKGRPSDKEIGIASAIKELTKYITKASSWSALSDDHLLEIAQVKRWPRCFELLGGWRELPTPETLCAGLRLFVLSLASYYDYATPETLCAGLLVAMLARVGYYKQRPVLEIGESEGWEDFCARVKREGAQPLSLARAWDKLNAEGRLYGRTNALLDTGDLSWSESSVQGLSPPTEGACRARAPSLMALGEWMRFDEWLKTVAVRLVVARRVRQFMLARANPQNTFVCLDGSTFGEAACDERRASRMEAIHRTLEGPY